MAKILVVEDDRVLREALVFKLTSEGFETLEAHNGEEGYQAIQAEKPDVVLLDIEMPRMSGIDVLKKMKDEHLSVKVIVLTNSEESEYLASALEFGVTVYLTKKSWTLEQVIEEVKKMLA